MWVQSESHEEQLCHCGHKATSELSHAEYMAIHQDASGPSSPVSSSLPSPPNTNMSFHSPTMGASTGLVPILEEGHLPSPSELLINENMAPVHVLPPHATTPSHQVSQQHS